MHVRSRKPLQDVLTAIRLGMPVAQLGRTLYPNSERHLRAIGRLAKFIRRTLLIETIAITERCNFSLNELRYEYPQELVPASETAISHLKKLSEAGAAQRYPNGVPENVTSLVNRELKLIEELGFESYFLHRARHRSICAQPAHSLPRPRFRGEFRRVLLLGHYRSRSRPHASVVRAFHFQGTQRTAGHRRRFRTSTPRRSDAIHLRKIRPRSRRVDGDVDYLSPAQRVARCRQSVGFDARSSGSLGEIHGWWDGKRVKSDRLREAGFDPRESG